MKNTFLVLLSLLMISSISFAQSEGLEFEVRDKQALFGEIKAPST